MPALLPLLDFTAPDAAQSWQAVNDGVMGGISDGRFKITNDKTLTEPDQINGLGFIAER